MTAPESRVDWRRVFGAAAVAFGAGSWAFVIAVVSPDADRAHATWRLIELAAPAGGFALLRWMFEPRTERRTTEIAIAFLIVVSIGVAAIVGFAIRPTLLRFDMGPGLLRLLIVATAIGVVGFVALAWPRRTGRSS